MYLEITDGPMQHHGEIKQVAQIAIEEYLGLHPEATEDECRDTAFIAMYAEFPPRHNNNIGEVCITIHHFGNKEWE